LTVINSKLFYIFDSKNNTSLDVDATSSNNNEISSISVSSSTNTIAITMSSAINALGFSFIHTDSTDKTNYIRSGPYNIFELNNELTNRMNELTRALDIVVRCSTITKYIINASDMFNVKYYKSGSNNPLSDPSLNFSNDLSACSVFSSNDITLFTPTYDRSTQYSSVTDFSGNIFKPSLYDASYVLTSYPSFEQGSSFAGKYGTTNANDQKNIKQMIGDMNNLLQNYKKIVDFFKTNGNFSDINKLSSHYDINNIKTLHAQNVSMRNDLDQKVQSMLGYKATYSYESKNHLDSTIYANIMLSILATTLIYFVLVKM
jgi:hypothetical protein